MVILDIYKDLVYAAALGAWPCWIFSTTFLEMRSGLSSWRSWPKVTVGQWPGFQSLSSLYQSQNFSSMQHACPRCRVIYLFIYFYLWTFITETDQRDLGTQFWEVEKGERGDRNRKREGICKKSRNIFIFINRYHCRFPIIIEQSILLMNNFTKKFCAFTNLPQPTSPTLFLVTSFCSGPPLPRLPTHILHQTTSHQKVLCSFTPTVSWIAFPRFIGNTSHHFSRLTSRNMPFQRPSLLSLPIPTSQLMGVCTNCLVRLS